MMCLSLGTPEVGSLFYVLLPVLSHRDWHGFLLLYWERESLVLLRRISFGLFLHTPQELLMA